MNDHPLPKMCWLAESSWSPQTRRWFCENGVDKVVAFSVPLTTRFRSVTEREGILVHGANGWAECAPFLEYSHQEASTWLLGAVADATSFGPPALRQQIPVNVTIPVGSPHDGAVRVREANCSTAKMKVADPRLTPDEDRDRVRAVAGALAEQFGPAGRLRIDVNGAWQKDEACRRLEELQAAASPVGGLEYVEQPCATVEELAYVRARSGVLVAADESIRRAEDPLRVVECEAADLAVIKVFPLGGVRAAFRLVEKLPIPVVVSSAIDTSVGLASGVRLAASLPELPFACGLDTQRLLGADVVKEKLRSHGGQLSVNAADLACRGELVKNWQPLSDSVVRRWVERTEQMISVIGGVG